jgi:serine phosphatase RsbU (regulator of sigma subunit)
VLLDELSKRAGHRQKSSPVSTVASLAEDPVLLLAWPSAFRLQAILANAGHLAPYRNGQEMLTSPALPLGLDPSAVFAEETYQLAQGDRLTLLTDGIPEATSHKELFGFERTAGISASPAGTIAEAALHFGQADDITVLSIVLNHPSKG